MLETELPSDSQTRLGPNPHDEIAMCDAALAVTSGEG